MKIDPRLTKKGLEPCYYFDLWLSTIHGIQNGSWMGLKKADQPFVDTKIHIHFMGGKWYSNFDFYIHRLRISLHFNNER